MNVACNVSSPHLFQLFSIIGEYPGRVDPVILHSREARPDDATQAWLVRNKPPLR